MSKRKPNGYWTLERCIEDAKQYRTNNEWRSAKGGSYPAALRKGWVDQCQAHLSLAYRPRGYWTLERCMEDALNYGTRSGWKEAGGGSYDFARSKGWLNQCCAHMKKVRKPKGHWTLEQCKKDAEQFAGRREWQLANTSGYDMALRNGWVDNCCAHMGQAGGTDNDVVYIWRDAGSDLHKVGVTSERIGEDRINICRRNNGMDPRIILMLKVEDARAVESQLLNLGTDPELDSSIDGYTEFRKLTDAELGQAVSIAYEAALAA